LCHYESERYALYRIGAAALRRTRTTALVSLVENRDEKSPRDTHTYSNPSPTVGTYQPSAQQCLLLGRILGNRLLPSSDLWDLRPLNRSRRSLARGIFTYPPSRICSSIIRALASISSPTRNQCISALNPPRAVILIFVVGGGGPNLTPLSATRFDESCSKPISSEIAVTSLLKYHGPCISYRSCDLQVSTETMPPVPFCLVIITSPFFPISAVGYPMSFFPSTTLNPEKLPPQT